MLSVNKWLAVSRKHIGLYEEIGRKQLIVCHLTPDRQDCAVEFKHDRTDAFMSDTLLALYAVGVPTVIETFLASNVLSFGPKVYRPTQLDCEALEQIKVSIPLEDYWQPYPTMMVEFPENYAKRRVVPCPQGGHTGMWIDDIMPPSHDPSFVISQFIPDLCILALSLYFDSWQAITRFIWTPRPGETVEDIFDSLPNLRGSMAMSDDEVRAATASFRIVINTCLLMKEHGCKLLGPDNPSHYDRLQRWLTKARKEKNQQKIAANERDLRLMPMIYGIGENFRLYNEERTSGHGESQGLVAAHWRQGHWTNQPYGPKQSLRKRMLLKPILVNKHLLGL